MREVPIQWENAQALYEYQREYFSQPGAVYGFNTTDSTCQYTAAVETTNDKGEFVIVDARCALGCALHPSIQAETLTNGSYEDINALACDPTIPIPEDDSHWQFAHQFENVDVEWLDVSQRTHDSHALGGEPMSKFVAELDELAAQFGLKVVTDDNDSA